MPEEEQVLGERTRDPAGTQDPPLNCHDRRSYGDLSLLGQV
jgi:hypothetical protein